MRAHPVPAPAPTDAASVHARFGHLPAADLIAALAAAYRGRIAPVSSFGADAAVLLHLVARADPAMPVLFLDTGHGFPETLAHRAALTARLGLADVRSLRPDPADLAAAGAAFELKAMPAGRDLIDELDSTVEEAGLKNGTVMIEYLDED